MGRQHVLRAAAGALIGVGLLVAVGLLLARALTSPSHRSAARAPAAPPAGCAGRLLKDWRDGRIDGTYHLACYRRAIKDLPVDLAVYSSAADDIRQALSDRIVQSATRAPLDTKRRGS